MIRSKNAFAFLILFQLLNFQLLAQSFKRSPLNTTQLVADKIVRNTPFQYQLTRQPFSQEFSDIKFINFSRTFHTDQRAIAYALSTLDSPADADINLEISHSSGLKIWLNKSLVYQNNTKKELEIKYKERAIELDTSVQISLKKGSNELLIKSESGEKNWQLYLRAGRVPKGLKLTVANLPLVDSSVAVLSNWLVIGPFPNPLRNGNLTGMDIVYEPEKEFRTGKTYHYGTSSLAWTIPKIELGVSSLGP
ncbi:MAG TPA: hypothetical protein VF602_12250, partial [Pedobacter sp.]